MPRPYLNYDHLRDLATGEAGALTVQPLRADDIHFDAAWSNAGGSADGQHGSTVLDIGRGVLVKAIGNAKLNGACWTVPHLTATQYPSGRELTIAQRQRAHDLIAGMIGEWAATHAGDIAQADDIDRNNSAHRLETQIERHEAALAILRHELEACAEGEAFSMYPDLPTDRR